MSRASALWNVLKLKYQLHWADLQAQLYIKITAINIDQYEKDIIKYMKVWCQAVNQINLHEWNLSDIFLAQQFINDLKMYTQFYIQF